MVSGDETEVMTWVTGFGGAIGQAYHGFLAEILASEQDEWAR